MFKKSKKRSVVVLALVGVLALAGVAAYAYWSNNGSGTASGQTAAGNQDLTVLTTSSLDGLYPGASIPVTGKFGNPNGNPVKVTNISVTPSVDSAHATAGCLVSDYSAAVHVTDPDVPASSQGGGFAGTLSMANTALDQNACKGATVTLTYSVS
jgi:ABC-type glycerol-3-phosphate transport system substrate-binding protein